jgi:hypothetical protein
VVGRGNKKKKTKYPFSTMQCCIFGETIGGNNINKDIEMKKRGYKRLERIDNEM